eukprot:1256707-Pleurochrysis_carterae.AAC.1
MLGSRSGVYTERRAGNETTPFTHACARVPQPRCCMHALRSRWAIPLSTPLEQRYRRPLAAGARGLRTCVRRICVCGAHREDAVLRRMVAVVRPDLRHVTCDPHAAREGC